jgi:hypothetical protein
MEIFMGAVGIRTVNGSMILLEDLSDEHLANWIFHAEKYMAWQYDDEFRGQLRDEAKRRGLSDEFLDKADGSFTRGNKRFKLDKDTGRYEEVKA